MPEAFEKCVADGGRVRTVSGPNKEHGLGEGEYVKYCYKGEDSFRGHIHKKQKGKTLATRS